MSAFQQYQAEFTGHIRNPKTSARPKGVPARRMRVYVEIVFNNMESTLSSCFPVCKKVVGMVRWNKLVRAFLTEHRCSTPLFRQIPEEFLRWLDGAQPQMLPPFFAQLAHYEWVELAVAVSDAQAAPCDASCDLLEGIPVLAPALMLLRYDWPVQRISPRFRPASPLDEPAWLLVFRDADDDVQFVELNPVSAHLVALLQQATATGRQALLQVAEALQHPQPGQLVAFGASVLEDLRRNGAILGAICK
jgi:hypothetical protein